MLTCVLVENQVDKVSLLRNYLSQIPQIRLLKVYDNWASAIHELPLMEIVDLLIGSSSAPEMSTSKISDILKPSIRKIVLCSDQSSDQQRSVEEIFDYNLCSAFSFTSFSNCLKILFPEVLLHENLNWKRDYFFIKNKENKNTTTKVNFKDIIAVESEHNYVRFYTTKGDIMAYLRLSEVKISLAGHGIFMQIHRCFIISKNYIVSIDSTNLIMEGNIHIRVGISYRESFFDYVRLNYITA